MKKPSQATNSPSQTHKQRQMVLRHGSGKTVFKSGLKGTLSPPQPVARRDYVHLLRVRFPDSLLEMPVLNWPSQAGEKTAGKVLDHGNTCPGREAKQEESECQCCSGAL